MASSRCLSHHLVGIPIGTNCAPLLYDIFFYIYEAEFILFALNGKEIVASRFNFTYRYIDDVLSINNPEFENYMGQMYSMNLRSYRQRTTLMLPTCIYSRRSGGTVNFTFPFMTNVMNSTSISQTVRSLVTIVVSKFVCLWRLISQLIRYTQAWSSYKCFILLATRL